MNARRVLFVTPTLSENSLGRTWALWMLAEHLGLDARVITLHGNALWHPAAGTAFASACTRLTGPRDVQRRALEAAAAAADVVVAVKPFDESFGAALRAAAATRTPLVLDIDDPDYESKFTWARKRGIVKRFLLRDAKAASLRRVRPFVRRQTTIVSNPELAALYGGTVVPHARPVPRDVARHESRAPTVAFVGTPRAHKGIDVLRAAVAALHPTGVRLVISGDAPSDARPWESWLGALPFDDAMDVLARSDIVALPSPQGSWSRGQLPAKLVDAMMFGRAVVASDVGPLAWALGTTGLVVPAGDHAALVGALRTLCDPVERAALGAAARCRAIEEFSLDALAPRFAHALDTARVPVTAPDWR